MRRTEPLHRAQRRPGATASTERARMAASAALDRTGLARGHPADRDGDGLQVQLLGAASAPTPPRAPARAGQAHGKRERAAPAPPARRRQPSVARERWKPAGGETQAGPGARCAARQRGPACRATSSISDCPNAEQPNPIRLQFVARRMTAHLTNPTLRDRSPTPSDQPY